MSSAVQTHENIWIRMQDGTRLAAKLWLPSDIPGDGIPGILEYIPYRKRDNTAFRDSTMHPYLASQGYACLRVDMRGSGESEGLLTDEYTEQELVDGCEVIQWLATQSFSSGDVGIIGISWGGFNGLQIAALQPPHLKSIITVCSTDDRYADDIHYMGGCLLGDNFSWATYMLALNSCPPDPEVVGDVWRAQWLQRLEANEFWLETWLRHQRRDEYWQHGSICEDYHRIQCSVFAISGWADGYSNSVFRMMKHLQCPRKALIGPWGHRYPHLGQPGPAIDFLGECLRWWDYWLKGKDNGVMQDPQIQGWMQESQPPSVSYEERPGRWVSEPSWPSPNISPVAFKLKTGQLVSADREIREKAMPIKSPLSVGLFAGKWCSFSATPDLPHDQREEDGGALVFTSERLKDRMEIFGAPVVELDVSCDSPQAMLAVRLSDVLPDDSATRVTFGLLNLAHRDDHANPDPLVPGQRFRIRINLNEIAHVFPAGHRIRLSVSTSYWPIAWPSPRPACVALHSNECFLILPQRESSADAGRSCEPPRPTDPLKVEHIQPRDYHWHVFRDLASDRSCLDVLKDEGVIYYPHIELFVGSKTSERYSSQGNLYRSVKAEAVAERSFRRKDWDIKTITQTQMTSDQHQFHLHSVVDAYQDDKRVFNKFRTCSIPRDHL